MPCRTAMVGPDTSVTGGLIAAGVLFGADRLLVQIRGHAKWLRRAVEGTPVLLVNDGQFLDEHLRRERVDRDEVLMAMREHGIGNVEEVRMAVIESDGSI